MTRFCLDTTALLTLRDDEPVADRVEQALEGPVRCTACFITRMEVLVRVWKDEGERAGRLAYEQLQALPIDWLEASEPLLIRAAQIKASHPLSLADAWIAAAASFRPSTAAPRSGCREGAGRWPAQVDGRRSAGHPESAQPPKAENRRG